MPKKERKYFKKPVDSKTITKINSVLTRDIHFKVVDNNSKDINKYFDKKK